MTDTPACEICGDPMPPGEEMFKFHGYSGPCPKPPLPKPTEFGDWQPIETAPKTARPLLGFLPAIKPRFPGEGYVSFIWLCNDDWATRILPGPSFPPNKPTHWMPLPKPPA